jgi:transcriptional regulator CtsR
MLKQSTLKYYLFKVMKKLNNLLTQHNFNESIKYHLDEDILEDINIILKNIDDWIRHYNSEIRMTMKKELMTNLGEIKQMFKQMININ